MKKISCLLILSINLNTYTLNLQTEPFPQSFSNFSNIVFFPNQYFIATNAYTESSDFYKYYSFNLKGFSIELLSLQSETKRELNSINWSPDFLALFENSSQEKKYECSCKIRARMEAEKRRKVAESKNVPENYFTPGNFDEENEVQPNKTDNFQDKQKCPEKQNESNKNKKKGCECKGNRVDLSHPNKDYLNGGFKPWSRAAIHRRHRISQNINYAITHGRK